MNETQLESLRRELDSNYRMINRELAKVNKEKPYFFLIDLPRKKEKIDQERKALEETRSALRAFQESIAPDSKKTPEQQEAAYKALQDAKEKYGMSSKAVSKLNLNTPFMNTLKEMNFNDVEKALDKQMLVIPAKKGETVEQYLIVMDGNIVYGKENTFIAASYDRMNGEFDKYSIETTGTTRENVLEAQHMDEKTFHKNLKKIEKENAIAARKERKAEKKDSEKFNLASKIRNMIA